NARKEIPAADRIAVLDLDGTLIEETPAPVTLFQYWEAYRKWLPGYAGVREFQEAVLEYTDRKKHPEAEMLAWYNTLEHGASLRLYEERASEFLDRRFSADRDREFWKEMEGIQPYPRPYDGKTYRQMIYAPMRSLIRLLQEAGFEVWLVTGTGKYFARLLAHDLEIPASRILGNEVELRPSGGLDDEILTKTFLAPPAAGRGKVTKIRSAIGKRPVFGAGNTSTDLDFLKYVGANDKLPRLNVVIAHHDEGNPAENSYLGYPAYAKESLEEEARKNGWVLVHMGGDWE
ncbi:MAG: haloacid dehalogenase-like hydrolase, partial [Elusimicrobia bacterium]|nr:haloacid dehalogenase-like hydrolase [Elusimicrobiota bacterium]